jgi:hypothetical protein
VIWTWVMWLRIESSGGLLWIRQWIFWFHKMLRSSWGAERLAASQEGLSSMELVTQLVNYQTEKLRRNSFHFNTSRLYTRVLTMFFHSLLKVMSKPMPAERRKYILR